MLSPADKIAGFEASLCSFRGALGGFAAIQGIFSVRL